MAALTLAACSGCSRGGNAGDAAPRMHQHHPPHGGTPIVLGDEVFHLEMVRDADTGTLDIYVLDGEMEEFIRCGETSFQVDIPGAGPDHALVFRPVANQATGERAGDSSQFEARADWVRTTPSFDGVLRRITIRQTTFADVKFNYPKGNDND